MMKKFILFFFLILFLSFSFSSEAKTFQELKAGVLKYDPSPAVQGEVFKVWIKIENIGTSSDDIEVRFVPEYPFSIAPGEEIRKKIGVIPGTKDAVIEFNIFVDLYAPNEVKDIKFQYKWVDENIWLEFKAPISLEHYDSLVIVESFDTFPKVIKPGDEIDIKIKIKNEGVTSVKNADFTLDTSGSDFFSPFSSGDTKRIDFLEPKESKEIIFSLMSDARAEIKIYTLPLKIKFRDDKNKEYEKTSKIGIKFNADPEITLVIDNSEIFKEKETGKVRLKVINKGMVDVKYINLKIVKTPDYDVFSHSNIIYIGNLDNDDFDSGEFIIKPLVKNPALKFILEYKDPYNKDYMQEFSLPLRIISKKDLGEKKSFLPFLIFVLVVGFLIYYFVRIKKKNKNKK
jgi:hypothetical protein